MRRFARVEVRKNPATPTWYEATLRDVVGGCAVVSFDDNVWPDREVPCSSVRPCPPECTNLVWTPQEGQAVEIHVAPSDQSPEGWTRGLVTVTREDEVEVTLDAHGACVVIQVALLRPPNRQQPLDVLSLHRHALPIESALRPWLASRDAWGCTENVRSMAGLAYAGAGNTDCGMAVRDADGVAILPGTEKGVAVDDGPLNAVLLLGTPEAIKVGSMLIKIHVTHQLQLEAFNGRRHKKLAIIERALQSSGGYKAGRTEFKVDADLVGRTLGKGFERVKKIEAEFGVEVWMVDAVREGEPSVIRILSDSQEDVDCAREKFELVCSEYVIDEAKIGWTLGKGFSEVTSLEKKTGLQSTRWTGEALELCGTRRSVEDATMFLDARLEYFSAYEDMRRETDEIQQSHKALDAEAAEMASISQRRFRSIGSGMGGNGGKGGGYMRLRGRSKSKADLPNGRGESERTKQATQRVIIMDHKSQVPARVWVTRPKTERVDMIPPTAEVFSIDT